MAGTAGRLGPPGAASGDRPSREYGKRGGRAEGEGESIRVCLRLRPQNKLEASRRSRNCVELHKGNTSITVDSPLEGEYDFSFDRVFDENAPQSNVHEFAAAPLATKVLDGYNCALVAYGQTGSGKTHTMMGVDGRIGNSSKQQRSEGNSGHTGTEKGSAAGDSEQKESTAGDSEANGSAVDDGKGDDSVEVDEKECAGMIPRTIKDLFKLMAESPPTVEYTVRCSYVEIYLEKILDLLNPANRKLYVADKHFREADITGEGSNENGGIIGIQGASEVCCFDESDLMNLLVRGNAVRTISSNEMSTNSSRSHAVFIIKIEQRDTAAESERTSQMLLVDMAGSEMAGKVSKQTKAQRGPVGSGTASPQEAKMVNKSLNALANVVKALSSGKGEGNNIPLDQHGSSIVPYRHSKLTRVLREAFGGNCLTTLILNASPSSYSISETIATIRFGQRCRRVQNNPRVKVDLSPADYRRQLATSEKKQKELMNFVKALAQECRSVKSEGTKGKLSKGSHCGPIWDSIDTILEESGAKGPEGAISGAAASYGNRRMSVVGSSITRRLSNEAEVADLASLREDLGKAQSELITLKEEVKKANEARDRAENVLSELQSEAAVLRTQNGNLNADKKKNMQDLIDAKNEIQILSQRKLEVEHNLRTSQFRENEATVFLRQFRRFYRRLLRNKAAQGTGDTSEITAKVPGVPDLNDLIDVDTLLLESGLIEEEEMHDDATVGTYRPSSQALLRSTAAAKKAAKEAVALEKALEGEGSEDGTSTMMGSSSAGSRKPVGTLDIGHAENLDAISEMGDGGVSEALGEQKVAETARPGRGADDLSSIGERMPTLSSVVDGASGDAEAGADAGAGSSAASELESAAGSLTDTISPQSIISRGRSHSGLSASSIAHRQKILRTPSGRLTTMREKDLERDLLQMTERCIELQIALNEEKANVDVLTNRSGSLSKKRLAQEAISLRQALDRKTHDLQAIIWKMNELHLINKTYNEKMANREQHVTYLEENLIDLQTTNRRLITDRQESEKKLRQELENLKVLVDGMTIPLWQFGECSVTEKTLANRMLIPVRGCKLGHKTDLDDEGSFSSQESDTLEGDADSGGERTKKSAVPARSNLSLVHATTQTDLPLVEEKGIMTDQVFGNGYIPEQNQAGSPLDGAAAAFVVSNAAQDLSNDDAGSGLASAQHSSDVQKDGLFPEKQKGMNGLMGEISGRDENDTSVAPSEQSKCSKALESNQEEDRVSPQLAGGGESSKAVGLTKEIEVQATPDAEDANESHQSVGKVSTPSGLQPSTVFPGGKSATSQPRRTVRKAGPTIKPGVLKESKKKGGSSVASSGSVSSRRQGSLHPSTASASGHGRPIMRKSRGEM